MSQRDAPAMVVRPRYVLPGNVYEVALDRIRWLWDEFDGHVSVASSGGKDSAVVVELTAMVAKERGAPPLRVMWLDQECEFDSTYRYQRHLADRPDINFDWYQIPFSLSNVTNHADPWLHVWGEGEEWVRPKEPDSVHVNDFFLKNGKRVNRFKDILTAIHQRHGGIVLSGMRAEESPQRRLQVTSGPCYKWVTWGAKGPENDYYLFHPIYDWTFRDVWKAIYDHDWTYNEMYDVQFRYGVPTRNMRVSNYHHETSIHALFYLQEAEPQTWEAATKRLQGISTMGHTGKADLVPDSLPYMFVDWEEYLDYLIENLCSEEIHRDIFRKMHKRTLNALPAYAETADGREEIARRMVGVVCRNDLDGTIIGMYVTLRRGASKGALARQAERNARV